MQLLAFLGLLVIGSIVLYVLLTPTKVKMGELTDGPHVLTLYKVGTAYKAWTGIEYIPIQKEFSICNERLCPLKQGEQVTVKGKKYTVQLSEQR
jgi:hypothetical protein